MTIRATATAAIKRIYPHVSEVQEWQTQSTIRLLWDRVHDLTEQLQAAQTTITDLVAGHNTNEATLDAVGQDARQALALGQQVGVGATRPGGAGGTGGGALPGGGDGGDGQEGCAAAGASGHDTGGLLNAIRAGQIVCGTAHEFPASLNATPNEATRNTNAETLVRRMIWHLKQAGFTAGRQRNPSSAISNDKLTVVVDGITRAYDVFIGKGNFSVPMSSSMREVTPPEMVDDAGIPD